MEYLILNQRLRLFAVKLRVANNRCHNFHTSCQMQNWNDDMMVEYQKIKSEKSDYALCESSKDSDWWCDNDPLVVEKTKLIGGLK